MKSKIFKLLLVSKREGDASWFFDIFIISLILLNVTAMVFGSVEPLRNSYPTVFKYIEIVSIIIFTVEYILRVWTANLNPKFNKPVIGNLKYAFTPLAIIDLLAILPFYLPFLGIDLRVFRIFRLFKIARYISALTLMHQVIKQKKEELMVSLIFTMFLLLITSTLMYYVEHDAQPANFSSIPETMWWGIATLTTVGYGIFNR
ncbi:ion transporter [Echinicola jeungdonensis]|uniref:Ion transporter n=1 Tax=Echinicola jeungdonensis TaxID=709343 RepID=A0ABV5J770_9BACT|nr:ion transporter [Echinicola jeungdonensis]MDN3669186.1 ion transporter [Echinicola jeungdonensis]